MEHKVEGWFVFYISSYIQSTRIMEEYIYIRCKDNHRPVEICGYCIVSWKL